MSVLYVSCYSQEIRWNVSLGSNTVQQHSSVKPCSTMYVQCSTKMWWSECWNTATAVDTVNIHRLTIDIPSVVWQHFCRGVCMYRYGPKSRVLCIKTRAVHSRINQSATRNISLPQLSAACQWLSSVTATCTATAAQNLSRCKVSGPTWNQWRSIIQKMLNVYMCIQDENPYSQSEKKNMCTAKG